MGNWCGALRRGNVDKKEQKEKVSTTKKHEEKLPVLQQRSFLQEQDCENPTEEVALKRQEEETLFEEMVCSESHEYMDAEGNAPR